MELINDLLPPLPDIKKIKPEETEIIAETRPHHLPHIFHDYKIHPNKNEIENILMKHLKTPNWGLSTKNHITVICNFKHNTYMSSKNILSSKVRCSECRLKISELSEIIYTSGIDKKIFAIIRINALGQVVLRCIAREHKMRITYDIEHPQELPTYCPSCIVDSSSSPSKLEEIELIKHFQDINLVKPRHSMSDSDMEEYFKYDSYLHHGGNNCDNMSDCEDNDKYALDTDNDSNQASDNESDYHSVDGCCSNKNYENYFDTMSIEENDISKALENSLY
jgi:hypothetical protein